MELSKICSLKQVEAYYVYILARLRQATLVLN